MIAEKKQAQQTQKRQHNKSCANRILFQEKRFDNATPVARELFR